jgi:subtilisin family serine protease
MADDTRVTHSRVGLACAVALLCAIGCCMPAAASAAEIIVRRDAGLSAAERTDVRAEAGVKLARKLIVTDTELVTVPDAHASDALDALNADPDVRYAEPVVTFSVAARSNDVYWDNQWGLENAGQWILRREGLEDADIDVPEAWLVSRGAGQTIGVVDTGIDLGHPDLLGQIAPGGRSFVAGVASPDDDQGHGTTVAGVLAAAANNAIGIAGVAPEAKVLPLKAMGRDGSGTSLALGDALAYAGGLGLRVVNASFGGPTDSQYVRDAIAAHPRTLYVVPAGNGEDYGSRYKGDDNDGPASGDSGPQFPCDLTLANVICVGATDNTDTVTDWSNYGRLSVDLFAPGAQIFTTVSSGSYWYGTGTSLSAPFVAGEAALLFSEHPNLTAPSVRHLILATVDPLDPGSPASVTGGRANAGSAVNAPVPDADGDGALDGLDDCGAVANAEQLDADGDGYGDVCDPTPRGDDVDGDSKAFLDDRCPFVAGTGPDGCPVVVNPPGGGGAPPAPTPTVTPAPTVTPSATPGPVIVSLGVKISKCPKGKACTKVAKVTVKLSRPAKVAVKVERRERNKKGRLVWTRTKTQSLTANASGSTVTVRGKRGGKPSRYRLTATLAGKAKAVSFTV